MTLRVRAVSDEERGELGRMARSRTLGAGLVRRARTVVHAPEGLKAPEIGARMGLRGAAVRHRLERFDARGPEGLGEDVRTGRPPARPAGQGSAVVDAAPARPAGPGLPFAAWTLDRPVARSAGRGIGTRRGRIGEVLIREGPRWRHGEARSGERVGPEPARERGRSGGPAPPHRPAASQPAWTGRAPGPAGATRAGGPSGRPARRRSAPGGGPTTAGVAAPAACPAPCSPRAVPPSR
jgi:transposase